jgi:methylenetetrahydrofolate dehydrogenase (NADP+)/methenyltetrahydrofolate cyclohydrolase/formyltetrahydrofolate synthetase
VECSGKNAVVLGRSNIVGMPVAHLLQSMDATVTVVHSRTTEEAKLHAIGRADILIAAIGKAHYVKADWLKPGCVVIDVGINDIPVRTGPLPRPRRGPDARPAQDATKKSGYRMVGDVDFHEAKYVASAITPVPGGVGPMTIGARANAPPHHGPARRPPAVRPRPVARG